MRTQAIENVLRKIMEAHKEGNTQALDQYVAKAHIVLDRDSTNASVIKELING